ncbi:hypothetical protein [Flavisolibacter nicotianae]|uniref:hypothetical protein n=1 Tax=Flavisolibacter nicotianae TaxID=2364882 RepID=UPI000EB2226D|nr:hypothetical protein [Flavisolibacter nicotianae]
MNDELLILIEKYLNGEATESEREAVDEWYLSFESHPGLTAQLGPEEAARAMTASFTALSRKLESTETDFHQ